jgi:hypothetical protein
MKFLKSTWSKAGVFAAVAGAVYVFAVTPAKADVNPNCDAAGKYAANQAATNASNQAAQSCAQQAQGNSQVMGQCMTNAQPSINFASQQAYWNAYNMCMVSIPH